MTDPMDLKDCSRLSIFSEAHPTEAFKNDEDRCERNANMKKANVPPLEAM